MGNSMNLHQYPVIMLAAGKGTRFYDKERNGNKTLHKINQSYPIFDVILDRLIMADVKNIVVITGFQSEKVQNHIERIRKKVHLKDIEVYGIVADKDYEKGPIYTLLTLKHKEHFLTQDLLTVIPSDTIFNNEIIKEIFS
ncbi:MAG: NTP transferase domain-containing protein, partial [Candidatus Lokiarchaeota archaeon]|nr:NTP transferase domain-containing protein [Candidatus Lokiarchaeota archaeon]